VILAGILLFCSGVFGGVATTLAVQAWRNVRHPFDNTERDARAFGPLSSLNGRNLHD
jgi:hypothetical protein